MLVKVVFIASQILFLEQRESMMSSVNDSIVENHECRELPQQANGYK